MAEWPRSIPGGRGSVRASPRCRPGRSHPPRSRVEIVAQANGMDCMDSPTRVVVLGSTGSIGRSALSVIEHDGGARLRAWGLSGHTRWKELASQALTHRPRFVAVGEPDVARRMEPELRGTGIEVVSGLDGVIRMVQHPETDRVLSAIVGAVGLSGTWAALEAGKIVALANKET